MNSSDINKTDINMLVQSLQKALQTSHGKEILHRELQRYMAEC